MLFHKNRAIKYYTTRSLYCSCRFLLIHRTASAPPLWVRKSACIVSSQSTRWCQCQVRTGNEFEQLSYKVFWCWIVQGSHLGSSCISCCDRVCMHQWWCSNLLCVVPLVQYREVYNSADWSLTGHKQVAGQLVESFADELSIEPFHYRAYSGEPMEGHHMQYEQDVSTQTPRGEENLQKALSWFKAHV